MPAVNVNGYDLYHYDEEQALIKDTIPVCEQATFEGSSATLPDDEQEWCAERTQEFVRIHTDRSQKHGCLRM